MRVAIVGAGWAGLAAAIAATQVGHQVCLFEASRAAGGRARALAATLPDGTATTLDNGQHILIGAYTDTLRLLRGVGVDPGQVLHALPLTLQGPNGHGLRLPDWPAPLDALAGIVGARGWSAADKWSLVRAVTRWQWQRFQCHPACTVAQLCQTLSARVLAGLIEPLCVAALNTPAAQASGTVFLRVLHDALLGHKGSSHLLLPRQHLGALLPEAALSWLARRGAQLCLGERVTAIVPSAATWHISSNHRSDSFQAVIVATSASHAARLLSQSAATAAPAPAQQLQSWASLAQALRFEAIATVYAWAPTAALAHPMLTLPSTAVAPAQFVFDRGRLGGPPGLLAFVVSAAQGERATLQTHVLQQAKAQLGLHLQAVRTVLEKRATFACTPGLLRPPQQIAPGLLACGDYVAGPYPATLEGAVRSGLGAANALPKTPL